MCRHIWCVQVRPKQPVCQGEKNVEIIDQLHLHIHIICVYIGVCLLYTHVHKKTHAYVYRFVYSTLKFINICECVFVCI
jgi:hypothetical protein